MCHSLTMRLATTRFYNIISVLLRRLEREVLAREVAEEKVEEIEAQAKARSEELVELRRLRREGEAANARLR